MRRRLTKKDLVSQLDMLRGFYTAPVRYVPASRVRAIRNTIGFVSVEHYAIGPILPGELGRIGLTRYRTGSRRTDCS